MAGATVARIERSCVTIMLTESPSASPNNIPLGKSTRRIASHDALFQLSYLCDFQDVATLANK